ncbi:MAG: hypothetical protein ACT4O9_01980 [Blastocatellia bacterium]
MADDETLPNSGTHILKPRAFDTIVFGGLAIGVLDFLDATIFFTQYFNISVARVWQGVAAGLIGRDAAVAGGWNTASLGILLHFVIAFLVAATYYLGTRFTGFLVRRPVVSGLAFGVIANFVMQYVVIPLSATPGTAAFRLVPFLNGVIGHAFLVGLPVALIAAWSAKRNKSK